MSELLPSTGQPSIKPGDAARPRRFRTLTLGCKVNQYETQYAQELLENAGWLAAGPEEPADLCLVNTCTVTHEADVKARNLIRRLHRQQPGGEIVVMGCYATRAPDEVGQLPGVSRVVTDKDSLAQDLQPWGVTDSLPGIRGFAGHQRAFVKVQDGCLLDCAYCIIPTVRPRFSSRPVDEIVSEVAGLVASGYREIVLGGIHLGHYGLDLSKGKPREQWSRLWHLLDRLESLPGEFRIRLSSLDAAEARESLLKSLAANRRVVPHLHLCLQSGSDRVLTTMRRRYSAGRFPAKVIHDRMGRAAEVEASLADAYRRSLAGRDLEVLVETADETRPGYVQGTACRGARVSLRGLLPALRRKLVPVRAIAVEGDMVVGEPVAEAQHAFHQENQTVLGRMQTDRITLPVC
ncbi:MAG: radical SAM protein [Gemmataceae bacterium]|nr:radical SAM protein [Gemmataceae bacterium]